MPDFAEQLTRLQQVAKLLLHDRAPMVDESEGTALAALLERYDRLRTQLAEHADYLSEDAVHSCAGEQGGLWIDGTFSTIQDLAHKASILLTDCPPLEQSPPEING